MFGKLYLLPVCRDSVYVLDDIFYYDDKLHSVAIKKLTEYGFTISGSAVSELIYENNKAYIGIDMDLIKLQYFFEDAISEPNRVYIMLCYKWQDIYLNRSNAPAKLAYSRACD